MVQNDTLTIDYPEDLIANENERKLIEHIIWYSDYYSILNSIINDFLVQMKIFL